MNSIFDYILDYLFVGLTIGLIACCLSTSIDYMSVISFGTCAAGVGVIHYIIKGTKK